MTEARILVVEDSDKKFDDIVACVADGCMTCSVTRAATMIDAEREISEQDWSLIILDISMDIAPSLYGRRGRGQANVGGLEIALKMFLLGREAPTIIVTAFDSFSTASLGHGGNEILGFEEISQRAGEYLGTSLVACLQYNSSNWKSAMVSSMQAVLAK